MVEIRDIMCFRDDNFHVCMFAFMWWWKCVQCVCSRVLEHNLEHENGMLKWCTMVSRFFNAFFLMLSVWPKAFLYWFLCKFLLIWRKFVQRWNWMFWARKIKETTYGASDGPLSLWWSVESLTMQWLRMT